MLVLYIHIFETRLKYEINIFQRPFFKLRDREMKESSLNLLSLCYRHKQNKQSQPNILLFITLLSTYLPGICFYGFITFLFTFCVSGHFFNWRCNPNVAIGDQTAAYEEIARCSMNCFQYRQVASHIFILLMIIYCHLQLLLIKVMIWHVSFVHLLFWMCVVFGFGYW